MTARIGVIGGGIAGLATAWYLKQRAGDRCEVTVLEASDRCGGRIRSVEAEGFLFEKGPRSCRTAGNGLATLELVEELAIEEEVIGSGNNAKQRYLYQEGVLKPLPSGPLSLLRSPFRSMILKGVWRDWKTSRGEASGETIGEFFKRRFGNAITEQLIDSLTAGIYAGDIDKLSMEDCFPKIVALERCGGSVVKGFLKRKEQERQVDSFLRRMQRESIFSFRGGMETIINALEAQLDGKIITGCRIEGLEVDGVVTVSSGSEEYCFDHVILAVPAHVAGPWLQGVLPEISGLLDTIPMASVATVNLGYRSNLLKKKGFGYLIPSKEKEQILGCVWDSAVFPEQQPEKSTVLTVMIGGARRPEVSKLSEQQLFDDALAAIERHLGIKAVPDVAAANIAKGAIPQYLVGHKSRVERMESLLEEQLPQVSITGSSYYGVAVNDCIAEAVRLAERIPLKPRNKTPVAKAICNK